MNNKTFIRQFRSALSISLRILTLATIFSLNSTQASEIEDVNELLRSGRLSEALVKANIYIAKKPDDPRMRLLKGVIQRHAGENSDSISIFKKLSEDYPELPEPYNNLAVIYAGQKKFEEARTFLEMAIRTNPSYATAHENLRDIYAALLNQDYYKKVFQFDSVNAGASPKLALIGDVFNPNLMKRSSALAGTVSKPVAVLVNSLPSGSTAVLAEIPSANTKQLGRPNTVKAVEIAVRNWANAWAMQDISSYLGFYSKDFVPTGNQSRGVWEKERRQRIAGKVSISVKLDDLHVVINDNKAVVSFRQDYQDNSLTQSVQKKLELLEIGNEWKIIKETINN